MEESFDCQHRRTQTIKLLKEAILRLSDKPNLENSIEERLHSLLPLPLPAPDHPPYVEMIIRAIQELNEVKGSTEASISSFIKSNYQDLPWAHPRFLTHHLKKLVEDGEIIYGTRSHCYTLPNANIAKRKGKKMESSSSSTSMVVDLSEIIEVEPLQKELAFPKQNEELVERSESIRTLMVFDDDEEEQQGDKEEKYFQGDVVMNGIPRGRHQRRSRSSQHSAVVTDDQEEEGHLSRTRSGRGRARGGGREREVEAEVKVEAEAEAEAERGRGRRRRRRSLKP